MEINKERIKEISISKQASILSALKMMDDTYKRLLLVFDHEKFVNVLSIGDIQRAIILNQDLDQQISTILRKETRLAFEHEPFPIIKNRMLQFRAECMPVIDMQGNLMDVYFWEDIFSAEEKRVTGNLNLPVVIMAGGKGSRLKPITNILPKALIPIGEQTMLEHIMKNFKDIGCSNFFFSVNYKADMIRYYFDNLNQQDYQISYFEEDKPLGTAGSLYMLKGKIDKTFFISNCDIIIDEDYGQIYNYHRENNNELTIVAALKHYPIPYGTIETGNNGMLLSITEKPELIFKINSGMYILEPHLLNEIPENSFFHITELIEKVRTRKGRIGVFPVSEKSWRDIGNWDEYYGAVKRS